MSIENHKVVSRSEWIAARKELLKKEKQSAHERDALSAQRRDLPWVKVDKSYTFDGTNEKQTLADLFEGRSQLVIYHFMFGPDWEEGCSGCSFLADHFDGANLHLAHHDVSLVVVSRAPLSKLEAFKKRMGWKFKWVSSGANDFNFDYHVSFTKEQTATGKIPYNYEEAEMSEEEMPGSSVFYKDAKGDIYHTYSSYARGLDILLGAHNFLDLTPKGRNETTTMDWVRHHDKYDAEADSCCSSKK
ncbi:MAG: thioredoxin family protein [Chthoniobacterales bacterium]